ncbi:MAG: cytochrome c oxidase subunit II, partial [Maricaulaceae bacterium]
MRARPLLQAFSGLLAALGLSAVLALSAAGPALAAAPEPGGVNLQPAATPIMEEIVDFHNFLLIVIVGVAAFVLLLLLWVMIRYNSKVNPTPAKFSHNTMVEIVWTLAPVIILLVIAVPSFRLLYNEDVIPDGVRVYGTGDQARVYPAPEVTIKATGQQWSWMYEYPDSGDFFFVSGLRAR